MNPYKRPEKETDPNKLPGQIKNPVGFLKPTYIGTLFKEIEDFEKECAKQKAEQKKEQK